MDIKPVKRVRVSALIPKKGEDKISNQVKLDGLNDGYPLIVDIVLKKGVIKSFKFTPGAIRNKANINYTVTGDDIVWLGGLKPKYLKKDWYKDVPIIDQGGIRKRGVEDKIVSSVPKERKKRKLREPQIKRVMIFDKAGNHLFICASVDDAAWITNLVPDAIEKMCKFKRNSQEAHFTFRFWRPKVYPEISSFKLSLDEYDSLCKGNRTH